MHIPNMNIKLSAKPPVKSNPIPIDNGPKTPPNSANVKNKPPAAPIFFEETPLVSIRTKIAIVIRDPLEIP